MSLNKQVEDLESEYRTETEEGDTALSEQEKQIESLRKEVGDSKGEGGMMKQRVRDLETELKDSLRKLDMLQRGIDPNRKTPVRKRYVSPGLKSNNSKKSVPRGTKNFLERNKRVSSLPNKQRTPSYARPIRQSYNRHQVQNKSVSNRGNSNNRSNVYSYGNRKPGYISRSNGPKSNSGSKRRQNTRPQLNGVFSRLYQSKQRDSPIRTNNTRVSPSYRTGGYKRSPGTRYQKPSPSGEGVKKRSPGTRVTTKFQVSSRLYPGPGTRDTKAKQSSSDRFSNSRTRRDKSNGNYNKGSYGYAPRPNRSSRSGPRSNSKNRSNSSFRDKYKSTSSGVYDRLYNNSNSRKNSKNRIKKPPMKPVHNNFLDQTDNSDLDIVHEKVKNEESKDFKSRHRKENNFKAANTSLERRMAARQNANKQNNVIQKELVRTKDPTPTNIVKKPNNSSMDLDQRFNRIAELIKKGNSDFKA